MFFFDRHGLISVVFLLLLSQVVAIFNIHQTISTNELLPNNGLDIFSTNEITQIQQELQKRSLILVHPPRLRKRTTTIEQHSSTRKSSPQQLNMTKKRYSRDLNSKDAFRRDFSNTTTDKHNLKFRTVYLTVFGLFLLLLFVSLAFAAHLKHVRIQDEAYEWRTNIKILGQQSVSSLISLSRSTPEY
mmetsp:Transcript_25060/g.32639  ORF Transcript_25060/g.32639 Transcript_25060/m.32639 type:complete len:187 (-) Transcript_25060:260-820(-)